MQTNNVLILSVAAEGNKLCGPLHLLVAAQHGTASNSHLGGIKGRKSHQLHHLDLIFCLAVHVLSCQNRMVLNSDTTTNVGVPKRFVLFT